MTETEIRVAVMEACGNYLKDAPHEPNLLRHFSGYLFFNLLRDKNCPVTDVSVGVFLDGLMIIVKQQGSKKGSESTCVYEAVRANNKFETRLMSIGGSGLVDKRN